MSTVNTVNDEQLAGFFRPNDSLVTTLMDAARANGVGLFDRLSMRIRLSRMSPAARQELELRLGAKLQGDVDAGLVRLKASDRFEGGVLVTSWRDLFEWFMTNLPAILEMISTIIALFADPSAMTTVILLWLCASLTGGLLVNVASRWLLTT